MERTHLLEIDFQLQSEKRREFNSSLESLLSGIGTGHNRASAYEDRDDGSRLLLVFEWSRRQDLEAFLGSKPFVVLLGCLKTLGKVSDCRIVDLSSSAGSAGNSGVYRWVDGWRMPPPLIPENPQGSS